LIERDERRSEPTDRDRATSSARPRAASQAPRVRRINNRNILFWYIIIWDKTIIAIIISSILSMARRVIKKRVRVSRNRVTLESIGAITNMAEVYVNIADGLKPFSGLQGRRLLVLAS